MKEKDFMLDAYEQEILNAIERWDYIEAPDSQAFIKELQQAVRDKYSKKRPISLRPLEYDILLIQEKARKEGIPYQTLLNSVIHKYATGQLIEKK